MQHFRMILRPCNLSGIINIGSEAIRTASPCVFGTSYISKRCAGHSQYANRKHAKQASANKRGELIKKYQFQINRIIQDTKDANLSTNTRLRTLLGEAMKNNVSKASLENVLKVAASTLNRDCINQFISVGPFGIVGILEMSSLRREQAKIQASGVLKKFGFKIVNENEIVVTSIGIIMCEPLPNVPNALDKAVEDAIVADCEEVSKTDTNHFKFQCSASYLDSSTKKLEELGYKVDHAETRFIFPESIAIEDEDILGKLNKMEEKLQTLPGFVRVSYNIE